MTDLRSDRWFDGDDEVAMLHRVAMTMKPEDRGRPVIGIATTASDFNPCHGDVPRLAAAVADEVVAAGGVPAMFPVMSLGEDLMKPSAMLYRNLQSMELEETVRSYPVDGLVVLAGCDKNVPAALMAMASSNIPSLVALVGMRRPGVLGERRLGGGTDVWRELQKRRTGQTSNAEWADFETALREVGPGVCNVMGTAVTMGILTETLGMALPGSATMEAGGDEILEAARASGRRIVEMVTADERPAERMTGPAFANAFIVLAALAGSTNAVIHLSAIAGRLGIEFPIDEMDDLLSRVPLLADVEPSGRGLAQDLHEAGGSLALFHSLGSLLDVGCRTAAGTTWAEATHGHAPRSSVIRTLSDPLLPAPTMAVIRGSLAPGGAVIKVAAASEHLLRHRGPAVVFEDYHDMRARLDDPELDLSPDSVLILRECGPVGAPGMPEWGMAPIPQKLADAGVTDMLRVSDGRMSGTSFGTVILHVTPESGIGGPLSLVQDGDQISFDLAERRLDLDVDEEELAARRDRWTPRPSPHTRGWPALYRRTVLDATRGCDLDFLAAERDGVPVFVEPVIGRS
ncbi:MAG: dihydroxy-acid dehydratase [Ilumatobacteraceae bacterium]